MKKTILLLSFFLLYRCKKDNSNFLLLQHNSKCSVDANSFGTGFNPVGKVIIDSIYKQDTHNMYFYTATDEAGHVFNIPNSDLYNCK
jgi:hypothetical protein